MRLWRPLSDQEPIGQKGGNSPCFQTGDVTPGRAEQDIPTRYHPTKSEQCIISSFSDYP